MKKKDTKKELGDKVSEDEKKPVEEAKEELKKKLEGNDVEEIKKATEKLSESFYPIAQKLYQVKSSR